LNTVDDVQQQASQRWNSSGPYGKKRPRRDTVTRGGDTSQTSVRQLLRRTLDSTATQQYDSSSVQQLRLTLATRRQHTRTAVRKLVRLRNSSITYRRTHTPTTSTSTTVAAVVRHRNYLSSATRAQFQLHCVSVINVNRLTELLRRTFTTPLSQVYLYSVTISSQLSSHTDASVPSTRWHGHTCTRTLQS